MASPQKSNVGAAPRLTSDIDGQLVIKIGDELVAHIPSFGVKIAAQRRHAVFRSILSIQK